MNDTPRTDAVAYSPDDNPHVAMMLMEMTIHARKMERELNTSLAENKRLTELLDACTVHSCGDHCQRPTCKRAMRNAIKSAYWQLLPFLKPGDEKTKAVLEQLQKFL